MSPTNKLEGDTNTADLADKDIKFELASLSIRVVSTKVVIALPPIFTFVAIVKVSVFVAPGQAVD